MLLTQQELAEIARTAIENTEAKYGKLRTVPDEALLAWASTALPKYEQMLEQEFEAHATHPDFLLVSDDTQEQLHYDTHEQVVSLLVDGLVARVWQLS
jgi:hypothetical protein